MATTLSLKNISGEISKINVDLNVPITTYLQEIKNIVNNQDGFKLIYRGTVLDLNKSFEYYKILPNDTILIFKNKAQVSPTPVATPPVTTTPVATLPVTTPPVATPPVATLPVTTQQHSINIVYDFIPIRLSTNQPEPEQQPEQNSTITQTIWQSPPNPNDHINVEQLYDIEHIHVGIMTIIPLIMLEPNIYQQLVSNPNNIFNIMNNTLYRERIRNIMRETPYNVNLLRSGQTINIQQPLQPQQPEPQLQQLPQIQQENLSNLFQEIFRNILNQRNQQPEHEHEHEEEEEEENNREEYNEHTEQEENLNITDKEKQDIETLIIFTGATKKDATKAYFKYNKNMDIAANKLMS